jgi:hypothetical protein
VTNGAEQKHDTKYFSYASCAGCNPAEAKDGRNQGDDEKYVPRLSRL